MDDRFAGTRDEKESINEENRKGLISEVRRGVRV